MGDTNIENFMLVNRQCNICSCADGLCLTNYAGPELLLKLLKLQQTWNLLVIWFERSKDKLIISFQQFPVLAGNGEISQLLDHCASKPWN
uniref:Uncharacterized protein n=1 Tax=Ditylenchus dipsaci TaxID=166011 RepID=A0A915EIL4_9BILA